jgi:RNA polymerase sigma-70 factor (ECF subfamily)
MQTGMEASRGAEDAYLVARAQEGYLDAFELLVQRHSAAAYRVALRLCGHHDDAQDIAQEALTSAWENLDRLKDGSLFATWLYRIVSSGDLLDAIPDPGSGPAAQAEQALAADAVTRALAALPIPQRLVVVLHHLEGLSYAEVASVTRSTIPAVRSHLFRARRTLGAELAEWR